MMRVSPGWKMTILGTEKYKADRAVIFVANHQSFLDIPFIFQLPWKMKWVVKHSMTYIPVMGWMVKLTGQLTINRKSKSALKKLSNLVQPLKDRVPVMIFPEGTRSLDGTIRSFKNGAFLLALEHGFLIQPIVIDGAHQTLQSGSGLLKPKAHFKLEVLDPIDPKNFDGLTDLKTHVRNVLIKHHQVLRRSD
jgi:1-acyl-sn-glycerol-3-phosphate acyltransferase